MQQFVFYDKSKTEMEIIIDVLASENIRYKIKSFLVKDFIFNEDDEEDDDDEFIIIEEMYDITCFTTLEHFDFVKHLANERIKNKIHLERNYLLPSYIKKKKQKGKKKNVSRISKKNITNTCKRNTSKPKK